LLRDFAFELNENGRDITENEYLESRLSNFSKVVTKETRRLERPY
jgi:hypothetical protein